MPDDNTIIESVKLLISRLEHLSADSRYAHRASGLRGSLWRCLEEMEAGLNSDQQRLDRLVTQSYTILEAAAREIKAPEK